MTNQVEVVALEPGHDGRMYRMAGERFHVPEERTTDGTTWFVPVDKAPAPKPVVKNARPPGAGPAKGSAVKDGEETPGAGPDAAR